MNYLRSMFQKKKPVAILDIVGNIDTKMGDRVVKSLNKADSKYACLLVRVNSRGGSPVQAQIISQRILSYTNKHKIPLVTFSEDISASAGKYIHHLLNTSPLTNSLGYFIQCIGQTVYSHPDSLVGSIGALSFQLNIRKTLNQIQIEPAHVYSQSSINRIFRITDYRSQQAIDYSLLHTQKVHSEFVKHVQKYRANKIDGNSTVYEADVFDGLQAKELGLVDEIGSIDEYVTSNYKGHKTVNLTAKSKWQQLE